MSPRGSGAGKPFGNCDATACIESPPQPEYDASAFSVLVVHLVRPLPGGGPHRREVRLGVLRGRPEVQSVVGPDPGPTRELAFERRDQRGAVPPEEAVEVLDRDPWR